MKSLKLSWYQIMIFAITLFSSLIFILGQIVAQVKLNKKVVTKVKKDDVSINPAAIAYSFGTINSM